MPIPWNLIIQLIIWLISTGMQQGKAVKFAAEKFGVSVLEIYKHGGF